MAANPETLPAVAAPRAPSLVAKIASRYSVDPQKMLSTLKATAFKQPKGRDGAPSAEVSNEQMMALLVVADQYQLNPFTKEIYAFADRNGIVPVVGVDGWVRMVNSHPEFNGVEFAYGPDVNGGAAAWVECVMFRRDRAHPLRVREFYEECKRDTGPWKQSPRRMLRHRAYVQCARLAFGFAGIYDDDEGRQIIDMGEAQPAPANDAVAALNRSIAPPAQPIEDAVERPAQVAEPAPTEAQAADPDAPRPPTRADVETMLKEATSVEHVAQAEALIASVAGVEAQDELRFMAAVRRDELAGN